MPSLPSSLLASLVPYSPAEPAAGETPDPPEVQAKGAKALSVGKVNLGWVTFIVILYLKAN